MLTGKGLRCGPAPLTGYQEAIKAEFTGTRGYWHWFWDEMLEPDPELFAAFSFASVLPGLARAKDQGIHLHRV